VSLGNPLGLLALLGVAAVFAIHLLRIRARRVQAATLFLLPATEVVTEGGRRLERLRSTPLLWSQLAAVLLLTWILVEPRWLREDSTRRIVLVVDVSASMSAFENLLPEALRENVGRLARAASKTEWVVLASDPRERTLYSGDSADEALAAAASFRPRLPTHDEGPVLATARSIASPSGLVVYVTDRPAPVPPGVEVLSIGSPLANVGFAGVEVTEEGSYRAIVKSSSGNRERRKWWIERDGASPEVLELEPFELAFVSGSFGTGEEELTLVLEGDGFTLDDRLPLVRPRLKLLRVYVAPELLTNRFVSRFVESVASVERVSSPDEADLVLARSRESSKSSIVFVPSGGSGASPRGPRSPLVSEKDALTDGLNFQGLLTHASGPAPNVSDRVLLWQGERALVFLAEGGSSSLVVGFALEESNADRVPAFVLLLHRFAESVRFSVVGFERRNVELHQLLNVAGATSGDRAPSEPGFFDIHGDQELLFRGAAHFADVREADLTRAEPRGLGAEAEREELRRNSLPDPLRSLWIVALVGLFVGASALQENPTRPTSPTK
jgi:hypothetical protein